MAPARCRDRIPAEIDGQDFGELLNENHALVPNEAVPNGLSHPKPHFFVKRFKWIAAALLLTIGAYVFLTTRAGRRTFPNRLPGVSEAVLTPSTSKGMYGTRRYDLPLDEFPSEPEFKASVRGSLSANGLRALWSAVADEPLPAFLTPVEGSYRSGTTDGATSASIEGLFECSDSKSMELEMEKLLKLWNGKYGTIRGHRITCTTINDGSGLTLGGKFGNGTKVIHAYNTHLAKIAGNHSIRLDQTGRFVEVRHRNGYEGEPEPFTEDE